MEEVQCQSISTRRRWAIRLLKDRKVEVAENAIQIRSRWRRVFVEAENLLRFEWPAKSGMKREEKPDAEVLE